MWRIYLSISILFISIKLSAQQTLRTINDKDLSSQQVFKIAQDKKGFVWFSDRYGVNRYDGYQVKHYEIPLVSNNVPARYIKVVTNQRKEVYAYNSNGDVLAYNTNSDRFRLVKNLGLYVRTAMVDNNGKVWFGSHDVIGELRPDTTIVLHKSPLLHECLVKEIIDYSPQEKIIIADYAILWFDTTNGRMFPFLSDKQYNDLKNIQIETAYLTEDKKTLWLGTVGKGVLVYDVNSKVLKNHVSLNASTMVSAIQTMGSSTMIVGTDGSGIFLIDSHSFKLKHQLTSYGKGEEHLRGDAVYDIFKDKEQRMWVATNNGITRMEGSLDGISVSSKENDKTGILRNDFVTKMMEDTERNFWIGTNAGLSYRNERTKAIKHLLPSIYILSLYEDSRGMIWAGTFGAGVYQFNKQGNLIKRYSRSSNTQTSLSTDFVYGIEEDTMGNMWFAGKKGEASRLDRKTDLFTPIPLNQTNSLIKTRSGNLLAATEFGLFEVNVLSLQVAEHELNKKLRSKYICDIYQESDKALWLATYGGGLVRYDLNTKETISVLTDESTRQEIIFSIVADKKGDYLWLAGIDRISSVNMKTLAVKNYPKKLLALDLNFLQASQVLNHAGLLFFGGTKGFVQIDPEKMITPRPSDKIVFLNFNLFNKVVESGMPGSPLEVPLDELKDISLEHSQHSFGLSFTTINFSQSVERRFMWKLEGFDEDWIAPGTENMVNYTNLNPGNYKFHLRALGNDNEILDERTIPIRIHPAIYKTTFAYVFYILLIAGAVYWLLRQIRIRAYLKSSLAFEKKEKERTEELAKSKLDFFTAVSHEIRTPISLIIGQVEQLMKSGNIHTQTQNRVQKIYRNALNLGSLINELLDFRKQDEGQLSLSLETVNMTELIQEVYLAFENKAQHKKIDFRVSLPEDKPVFLVLDRLQMNKVLNNLLSNAFKATQSGGRIKITLEELTDDVILTIRDTGRGIPTDKLAHLFQPFYQIEPNAVGSTGIGLAITKNIVELHGGRIEVVSEEGIGTTFQVNLKKTNVISEESAISQIYEQEVYSGADLQWIDEHEGITDPEQKPGRPTILLVEDNEELLAFVREILMPLFNVIVATDGLQGFEKATVAQPDIIISDVMMPNLSGTELCAKLKNNFDTSHIPIILLTARAAVEHQLEGLRVGADDYVVKPFHSELLIQRCNNLINSRNLLKKRFFKEPDSDSKELVGTSEVDRAFLEKATAIVESRLESELDIGILAQELGLSRSSLFSKLKGITGLTPNVFISTIRLKKAAFLLLHSPELNIGEVAYTMGFSSPRYFNKCFREQFGCSPQEYRKKHAHTNHR
ncbi:hybrid sensor histidine kinase/response regulator transcription factor [Sphingobacterium chuzhouense]|uniref:histidine kinase n=1 Tax=Sphingobacterium chuzhouense TaxID=1742264 RepID=A0ABR7XQN7_9SPHI|nr:two-component regulator propeller domain-containing protein [Sphingobacterium chuzhouense]MBD1420844.1 response regulator [Sphingobacterium chuzhouense]